MAGAVSDAALRNGRHIARFEAKDCVVHLPETAVTQAFEARAYPKLVRQLRHEERSVRHKAVLAARELMVAPEKLVQCIAAGITPALIALVQEADDGIRRDAASTLKLLLRRELGVRDALQHGALPPLLAMLSRECPREVREAAYVALQEACAYECGRSAMVALKGALPGLVSRVQQEEDPGCMTKALDVLLACTQVRNNDAALGQLIYNASAMPVLTDLLGSSRQPEGVQQATVRLLSALCSNHSQAIYQAVASGCVPHLVRLLSRSVRCSSSSGSGNGGSDSSAASQADMSALASALMHVSKAKEGREAFVKAGGVEVLSELLRSRVATNVTRAFVTLQPGSDEVLDAATLAFLLHISANTAELPEGRQQLLSSGVAEAIRQVAQQQPRGSGSMGGSDNASGDARNVEIALAKAASEAHRMLGFQHWPQ